MQRHMVLHRFLNSLALSSSFEFFGRIEDFLSDPIGFFLQSEPTFYRCKLEIKVLCSFYFATQKFELDVYLHLPVQDHNIIFGFCSYCVYVICNSAVNSEENEQATPKLPKHFLLQMCYT